MTRRELDADRLRRLLDKDEITTLLQRWAHAVGRADWEAVRSAFYDDAFDTHGTFDAEADAFVAWQRQHHEGIEQSVHFLSPINVEFADEDTALCQCYVTVYQRFGVEARQARADVLGPHASGQAKPLNAILVGRYVDRVERRDESWKIASRLVVFEWNSVVDAPWEAPFQPGWTVAKRDRSDPVYALREQMGLP